MVVAAAATAAAHAPGPDGPAPHGPAAGYDGITLPAPGQLVPPPPAYGSPAAALDAELFLQTRRLEETDPARWAQARRDADDRPLALLAGFAAASGRPAPNAGPATLRLVARTEGFVAASLAADQHLWRRARPYRHNHQSICVPRFTALDRSPSYPSAEAAEAMAVALVLGALDPGRLGALLVRARDYGESGVICGVQWASDVAAGEQAGAVLVSLLQSSAAFHADLDAARREEGHISTR